MDLFEEYKNCLTCGEKLNSLEEFNYCNNLFCKDKFMVYKDYIEYEKYLSNNINHLICCNFLTKEFKYIVFKYDNYKTQDNSILEVEFEIDSDFNFVDCFLKIEKSIEKNTLFK